MKSALLLLLALLTAGCTERAKPLREHAGPVVNKYADTAEVGGEKVSPTPGASKLRDAFLKSGDSLNEVVIPLANIVLGKARIRSEGSLNNDEFRGELIVLNEFIIELSANRTQSGFVELISKYVEAVRTDCEGTLDSCRGLQYFRQAHNSVEVIKLAAQLFPKNRLELLLYGISLKNGERDVELSRSLLNIPLADLKDFPPRFRENYFAAVNTLLISLSTQLTDFEESRKFLNSIDVWKFILNKEWRLESGTKKVLWELLARTQMLYKEGKTLNPRFAELLAITKMNSNAIMQVQKIFEWPTKVFPVEAWDTKLITEYDELVFLTDAVYVGTMDAETASIVALSLKIPASTFLQVQENYLRLRYLVSLSATNDNAAIFFNTPMATDKVFRYVYDSAGGPKQTWSEALSSFASVRQYVGLVVQRSSDSEEIRRKFDAFVNSFNRAITMSSIYPHIFVLNHKISQQNITYYLPGHGARKSHAMANELFTGRIPPFLKYAENVTTLNFFELTQAFDTGIRSNLFKTVGLDVDTVLSHLYSRLSQQQRIEIEDAFHLVRLRLQEAELAGEFLKICQGFKTGVAPGNRTIKLEDLVFSPYYGNFGRNVYTSMSAAGTSTGVNGGVDKRDMTLMYADGRFNEALETLRIELEPYSQMIEGLLNSYSVHLAKHEGLTAAQITEKTKLTRAQLDRYKRFRENVLKSAVSWHDSMGSCYENMAEVEIKMRGQVIAMEKEFLTQIYRDIKKLRNPQVSVAEKSQIDQKYRLKGIPGGFDGGDRISDVGYKYTQISTLIRVRSYLLNGLNTDVGSLPAIAPDLKIEMGTGIDIQNKFVKRGIVKHIPFGESEQEFVKTGLSYMLSDSTPMGPHLRWLTNSSNHIGFIRELVTAEVSLFRLESVLPDQKLSLTAQDLFTTYEKRLSLMRYEQDEREFFNEMYIYSRFDPLSYMNLMGDFTSNNSGVGKVLQRLWGLFDLPIKISTYDKLGDDFLYEWNKSDIPDSSKPPIRYGYREYADLYFKARAKSLRTQSILPYSASLDAFYDGNIAGYMRRDLNAIDTFLNAGVMHINATINRPAEERPWIDINMEVSNHDLFLSENLLPSYRSQTQRFHLQTQNCFNADAAENSCSEF